MAAGTSGRRRLQDLDAIREALDHDESIVALLRRDATLSDSAEALVARARDRGVPIQRVSDRELRRLSSGASACELLAAVGPPIDPSLEALMAREGLLLLLVGLRYPGNVGFILRSAEVAGAAGVVLSNDWQGAQREEAERVSMGAGRFLPILAADAREAVTEAKRAGRRVLAVETGGAVTPWQADLGGPLVLMLGGEAEGIPDELLQQSDAVLRIPTPGVIPSYNVQAAVGMLLGEWLRQTLRESE